jgi:hypothetical protein
MISPTKFHWVNSSGMSFLILKETPLELNCLKTNAAHARKGELYFHLFLSITLQRHLFPFRNGWYNFTNTLTTLVVIRNLENKRCSKIAAMGQPRATCKPGF